MAISAREQYGMVVGTARHEDAAQIEHTTEILRELAQEWLALQDLNATGEVVVIRHSDVSEADWHLMQVTGQWEPGAEVWGWKVEAESVHQPDDVVDVTSVTTTSSQYGRLNPDGTWEIQEVLPDAIR